jgi:hypothetical protein
VTTTPPPPAAVPGVPLLDVDRTDRVLAHRAKTSAAVLAGLIAAGTAETAYPTQLPADMFPDLDPTVVERVWNAALRVGVCVGKGLARPRWDTRTLDRLRAELADAGYHRMGRLVEGAAFAAPSRPEEHPADTDDPWAHP